MRAPLALLLAAGLGALPGSAAAFEAYVAAVMPLQVSPSSLARPVTTMAANIPFNVLGCGRWCQVQYGGTMGYVPAAFVVPGAPPPAPGAIAPPFVLPFAAPGLLLIGLGLLFPAIWTVYLGMTNYRLTGFAAANPEFVGLENFSTALNDPRFWNSLWNVT